MNETDLRGIKFIFNPGKDPFYIDPVFNIM